MEMACDDRQRGPTDQPAPGMEPARMLTTQALVLCRDATLLLTLSLLAPAVIVIRVPIMGTHGSVGPVTDDAVAGTAGAASAGQADSIESARLQALVWGSREIRRVREPYQTSLGWVGAPWTHGVKTGDPGDLRGRWGRAGLWVMQSPRKGPSPRSRPPRGWHWPERTFWRRRPRAAPVRPMMQSLS